MKALLFVIFITLFQCSCNSITNPFETESKVKELKVNSVNEDGNYHVFAKTMAKFIADEKNRIFLFNEVKNSKKVEQILEMTEFLNLSFEDYKVKDKMLRYCSEIEKRILSKIFNELQYGQLDLYFPVKKWREKMNSKDNIYVSYVNQAVAQKSEYLKAYDMKGNEIKLSTKFEPSNPVLCLAKSEKNKNYKTSDGLNFSFKDLENGQTVNYERRLIKLYIKKDYDSGWFGGDMEIYFKVNLHGNTNWEVITPTIDGVKANQAKEVNVLLTSYFSDNYSFALEVWESDGGLNGGDDFVADAYWNNIRVGEHPGQWGDGWKSGNWYYLNWFPYRDIQICDGVLESADYDCFIIRRTTSL